MSRPTIRHAEVNDTDSAAETAWLARIRDLSPTQRLEKGCGLSQRGRRFAMEAIRRRHPAASATEVRLRFIELAFGPAMAAVFDRLRVRHYIGGSVASTMHGAIRSTMDVDVICDLRADQVDAFLSAFGGDFYVSEAAVRCRRDGAGSSPAIGRGTDNHRAGARSRHAESAGLLKTR